jgi:hypothetical protein
MIGIFKVAYEKVLDLSKEEAKKLDEFMEEHFELSGDPFARSTLLCSGRL